ncbi:MAG: hypothetical protein OSJ62_15560 [Lachnospiraceae bacterium]|nr:hypothetical protein [Lachnospiraceae bacterium]
MNSRANVIEVLRMKMREVENLKYINEEELKSLESAVDKVLETNEARKRNKYRRKVIPYFDGILDEVIIDCGSRYISMEDIGYELVRRITYGEKDKYLCIVSIWMWGWQALMIVNEKVYSRMCSCLKERNIMMSEKDATLVEMEIKSHIINRLYFTYSEKFRYFLEGLYMYEEYRKWCENLSREDIKRQKEEISLEANALTFLNNIWFLGATNDKYDISLFESTKEGEEHVPKRNGVFDVKIKDNIIEYYNLQRGYIMRFIPNNDKFQTVDINTVDGIDTEDFTVFEYNMQEHNSKKITELFERFTSYLEIMITMRSLD